LSNILLDDSLRIIADEHIPWDALSNSTVLVTGAGGLIGGALIRTLQALNEKYAYSIDIIALTRSRPERIDDANCNIFYIHDVRRPLTIKDNVDYIIHCAAVTKSLEMAQNPVGVINNEFIGTNNILTFATEKQIKSIVYLSSMEVYGVTNGEAVYATEDFQGYIDLKSPRSCYPQSKRMSECLCQCYHSQYGVPVKIARLAQTFGAGVSFEDTRVFAQFAKNAVSGKNIELHTDGKSRGNYCYISDTVRGLFTILLNGEPGGVYNVSNPDSSITIRQMANMLANKVFNGKISVMVDIPSNVSKLGYAPDSNITLSSKKLEALGWKSKYSLSDMYLRMIEYWHECGYID